MFRKFVSFIIATALVMTASMAFATYTTLTTAAFRQNGAAISPSGLDTNGLGTVSLTYGAGTYDVLAYVDHEIDLLETGFWNEFATATGTAAIGQSYEAGIPNFPSVSGDIYDNFLNNALGNTVNNLDTVPDDVAMAMGRHFVVDAGQKAYLIFTLTEDLNGYGGFYLTQTDDLSGNNLYFYSTLEIKDDTNPVPEPSTFALLGLALGGAALFRKRLRG
jgi:hypothetical protein